MSESPREDLAELVRLVVAHVGWQQELGGVEVPRGLAMPAPALHRAPSPEPAPAVARAPEPPPAVAPPPVAAPPPAAPPAAPPPAAPPPVVARPAAPLALFHEPAAPAKVQGPPLVGQARLDALKVIADEVRGCTACRLAGGRRNTVFARGNPFARLAFVGEGPGEQEDIQGLPFVGPAGQLLDKIIGAMGLGPDDVYVANIVKCLRRTTLVQLENGSWEQIGRLVRQRYAGRVMSVAEDGRLVKRRVTGWYESPLGARRVYKLSYRSSSVQGGNRATTWLTEDHPVLTRRGWVEARDLQADDRVAVGQGLSHVASEVVLGSLLGDASINAKSAHLEMAHCRDQRDYVALKARALAELSPIVYEGTATARDDGKTHLTMRCRTRASRALRVLRSHFYPDGRKRVPPGLRLTPGIVAVWFLDDGYTRVRSDTNALSEIAAHSFVPEDIHRLIARLRLDLDVEAYTRDTSPGRIFFGAEATLRLSELVARYCPPALRYKLHPTVERVTPFDPSLYIPGEPETLYDQVVIEPVEFKGPDRMFFCIDVEETHNFVTSGGVVHNCRPPNNRVPEGDEMRACTPYLVRQLGLVRPEVIVALGRTAVGFLLDTPSSMTKLRGRWYEYEGIPVLPTWHPAYLLRNPAAKPDTWKDMKLVMERLGLPLPKKG